MVIKPSETQVETKQDRVEIVNQLIQFISERGRRFFYTKRTIHNDDAHSVASMKLKNGRVYFVDNYTTKEMHVVDSYYKWKGFSHGGTLRALVMDFADFIRTGKHTNGEHGYGGLHCSHWGHNDDIQREIIAYAKEIGYLRGKHSE